MIDIEGSNNTYKQLAAVYLRFVRRYSPHASETLEQLYPLGASTVFRAALAVIDFNSEMKRSGNWLLIDRTAYHLYVGRATQAIPLLAYAFDCLIQDTYAASLQTERQ